MAAGFAGTLALLGIASVLMFGATTLMAQQQKNPGDIGNAEAATKNKGAPTDPTKKEDGVGSRPFGPVKDDKPTDPNQGKAPEVKKQEKESTNK